MTSKSFSPELMKRMLRKITMTTKVDFKYPKCGIKNEYANFSSCLGFELPLSKNLEKT